MSIVRLDCEGYTDWGEYASAVLEINGFARNPDGTYKVASDTRLVCYTVTLSTCTCPARGGCKHMEKLRQVLLFLGGEGHELFFSRYR